MPDDVIDEGATAAAAQAVAEAAKVVAPDLGAERMARIEAAVSALSDTVKATLAPKAPLADAQGRIVVQPGMRQLLRQQGLSDGDIDALAPQIMPFMGAMLATDGMTLVREIEATKDEVALLRAARNEKAYPHFALLAEEIDSVRADALKRGQPLSVKAAYEAAVAANVDKIADARGARRAQSDAERESDLPLTDHGRSEGRPQGSRRTAMTADQLAALPREKRAEMFEKLGNQPIR